MSLNDTSLNPTLGSDINVGVRNPSSKAVYGDKESDNNAKLYDANAAAGVRDLQTGPGVAEADTTTLSHSKVQPLDKTSSPASADRLETDQGPAQPATQSGASILDQASKVVSDGVEAVKKSLS